MSWILLIDTSVTTCSIGIANDGELVSERTVTPEGYKHAELIHQFILDVTKEAQIELKDISAVGFCEGPGSYTGLRIGASAAKGLCFALNIPLITISTLDAMFSMFKIKNKVLKEKLYMPMIDARRMEVYTALYSHDEKIKADAPLIFEDDTFSNDKDLAGKKVIAFGDGAAKIKGKYDHVIVEDNFEVSVQGMVDMVHNKFLHKDFPDMTYFEPNYIKSFQAGQKK